MPIELPVGEYVLADASRGQDDPFGIQLGQVVRGDGTLDLILEGVLEYRRAQFVLAEEGELSPILQAEEIGKLPLFPDLGLLGVLSRWRCRTGARRRR